MIDDKTLTEIQNASIKERIVIIETILKSLKSDMNKATSPQSEFTGAKQRPAFKFMKDTGKILGDVVTPVLPEDMWEVLR